MIGNIFKDNELDKKVVCAKFAHTTQHGAIKGKGQVSETEFYNLDIFWLKDKSLTGLDNLPDPDILASEIIENIESGLNGFREIMETINGNSQE